MILVITMVCLFTSAASEMHTMHHTSYISRKSRSNSPGIKTGSVYNQVDSDPARYTTYGALGDHMTYSIEEPVKKYSDYSTGFAPTLRHIGEHYPLSKSIGMMGSEPDITTPKYDIDYAIAKARSKYESKLLPSKMRSDAMYEKLKSVMHYNPPTELSNMAAGYGSSDYHADDDDVRTSSRSSYHGWPYFYHTPYEYEVMKSDSEIEKAKDKRFAASSVDAVIPVHEIIEDDKPNYEIPPVTPRFYREISTDNPIVGDEPFFSFVLNDYFDKNNEEDSLVFKGFDWGQDFDQEYSPKDLDYTSRRDRRLGSTYHKPNTLNTSGVKASNDDIKISKGESTKNAGYNTKHDFDKYEKGGDEKEKHKSKYEGSRHHYNGFKDFVDTFANKFGKEDQKKDSKYSLKTNQDKGEKKKGFRKVYHKDEYEEDNEFYDNTNNSAKSDEKGSVSVHNGGSEAIVKSHATAATGDEGIASSNAGDFEKKRFENNHKGRVGANGLESQFNKYRDVAKEAAQSNNADYNDHLFSNQ